MTKQLSLARLLGLGALLCLAAAAAACNSDSSGANGVIDAGLDIDAPGTMAMDPHLDPACDTTVSTCHWLCPSATDPNRYCECDDGQDNDGDTTTDGLDPECAAGPWVDSEATGPTGACGPTQCTNCTDDDTDGLIDSQDPECTGPLDNDEFSFATGIPGDNKDECHQDCWFDGDSGSGNDGCNWQLGCDPVAGPAYGCKAQTGGNCDKSQTQACIDFCSRLTPNGCDCFGCCTVFVDGVGHDVLLNPACSVDDIKANNGDCVSCTKVASCNNECDPCEYCIGRPPTMSCETPPTDGGVNPGQCPTGVTACNPNDIDGAACPVGFYCLTGCCVAVLD